MQRPAVLHIVNLLVLGGTERQMFELLRRQAARGPFRPLVASLTPDGELAAPLTALGCPPRHVPLAGSLARPNTFLQTVRLAAFCRRERVRVIHAHDLYSNVVGALAGKLGRIPVVASRRDIGEWLGPTQRRLRALSYRLADRVVANAAALDDILAHEGVPAGKRRVVPNGIDLAAFDDAAVRPPDPALPPRRPGVARVAMIGNMDRPHKGHADLLEAAAILAARGRAAQWLLVSDGPRRAELEIRAARLGLAHDVQFLGRRPDVPALLSRVDLLVSPSWSEGFPNVVLEAMAARRAVVATDVGGSRELVRHGETGLLVPPRDPGALAAAVLRLVDDPIGRAAMGNRARERVARLYGLDRMVTAFDALYAEIVPDR